MVKNWLFQKLRFRNKTYGRRLELSVFYPKLKGKFPIILFSTGSSIPSSTYFYLAEEWVRSNFVCIFIQHYGDSESIDNSNFHKIRVSDIVSVLDSLSKIEKKLKRFKGEFDINKIGIAGHSLGAYVALLLSGATIRTVRNIKKQISFSDKRVKAIITFSPPGPGAFGLTNESYKNLGTPYLNVSGEFDYDNYFAKKPKWRSLPYQLSCKLFDRYNYIVTEGNHFSFVNTVCFFDDSITVPDEKILSRISKISKLFWNAYLWNERKSKLKLKNTSGIKMKLGSLHEP